jgi:hypothetical protein
MRLMAFLLSAAILLVVFLCYMDRQESDARALERDKATEIANKRKAAQQVQWVDLDKVGRYMVSFDRIKKDGSK